MKPTLQLVDYPHIFAAGDVIDWSEQKQAAKTASHAGVIVKNILSLLAGKSDALAEYKGSPELIFVTNGRVSRRFLAALRCANTGPTEWRHGLRVILWRIYAGRFLGAVAESTGADAWHVSVEFGLLSGGVILFHGSDFVSCSRPGTTLNSVAVYDQSCGSSLALSKPPFHAPSPSHAVLFPFHFQASDQ